MAKANSRLRKYVKLRKILKNRLFSKAVKYIGAALVVMTNQGAASGPEKGDDNNRERDLGTTELTVTDSFNSFVMNEVDFENEINKRAEWFVGQYLDSLKVSLDEIKNLKKYKERKNYICENFFDRVYPAGRLKLDNYYCAAAAMSGLVSVNEKYGDLDNFIPDGNTKAGSAMVSCDDLPKYIHKKYKDCIKEYIYGERGAKKTKSGESFKIENLEPGDILVQKSDVNTSSGWHTVVYNGEGEVISFNRDGIFKLQKNKPIKVIKMPNIIRREWQEKSRNYNLADRREAFDFYTELYLGRDREFVENIEKLKLDRWEKNLEKLEPLAPKFYIEGKTSLVDWSSKDMKKSIIPWQAFAKISGKKLSK